MAVKNVRVKLSVDARQAIGETDKYAASNARASKSAKSLGERTVSATSKMRSYGFAVTAAALAVDRLSQRSLQYSESVKSLPFSIDAAKKSMGGLVTNFDTVKIAVAANRLEVAKSSGELAKLTKIGATLARTQGTDITRGVNDFTLAIARQSSLRLDNLGITVKQGEANRFYSRTLGKTADELTDLERKEAFKALAIKKGLVLIRSAKTETDSWALSLQKLKVAITDAADSALALDKNLEDLGEETRKMAEGALFDLTGSSDAATRSTNFLSEALGTGFNAALSKASFGLFGQTALDRKLEQQQYATSESTQRGISNFSRLQTVLANSAFEVNKLTLAFQFLDQVRNKERRLRSEEDSASDLKRRTKRDKAEASARFDFEFKKQRALGAQAAKIAKARRGKKDTRSEFEKLLGLRKGAEKRTDELIRQRAEGEKALAEFLKDPEFDATPQIEAARDAERAKSEAILNERLRSIEIQREAGVDPMTLIANQEAAEVAFLERELTMLRNQGAEKAVIMQQEQAIAEAHHQASLARLKEENRKRMEHTKLIQTASVTAGSAFLSMGHAAAVAALDTEAGVRAAVHGFAKAQAKEASLTALMEGLRGAVAAASPFTAALAPAHFVNAATATGLAVTMGGIAGATGGPRQTGGGRGVAGAGTLDFSNGPGAPRPAASGSPGGSNVDTGGIPTSPANTAPSPRQSSTAPGAVFNEGAIQIFGEWDDASVDKLRSRLNERDRQVPTRDL